MALESFYPGDEAFSKFSDCFAREWEAFEDKYGLLEAVDGNLELARPIAFHLGPQYKAWLACRIPALDRQSPQECLQTIEGVRRLKTCLMRMP